MEHLSLLQKQSTVYINLFTYTVKHRLMQNFQTFDSMNRLLTCFHWLESCSVVLYCGAVYFAILFSLLLNVLENLSVLSTLMGAKEVTFSLKRMNFIDFTWQLVMPWD